jgi:hypothetical protein
LHGVHHRHRQLVEPLRGTHAGPEPVFRPVRTFFAAIIIAAILLAPLTVLIAALTGRARASANAEIYKQLREDAFNRCFDQIRAVDVALTEEGVENAKATVTLATPLDRGADSISNTYTYLLTCLQQCFALFQCEVEMNLPPTPYHPIHVNAFVKRVKVKPNRHRKAYFGCRSASTGSVSALPLARLSRSNHAALDRTRSEGATHSSGATNPLAGDTIESVKLSPGRLPGALDERTGTQVALHARKGFEPACQQAGNDGVGDLETLADFSRHEAVETELGQLCRFGFHGTLYNFRATTGQQNRSARARWHEAL